MEGAETLRPSSLAPKSTLSPMLRALLGLEHADWCGPLASTMPRILSPRALFGESEICGVETAHCRRKWGKTIHPSAHHGGAVKAPHVITVVFAQQHGFITVEPGAQSARRL
eukprot:CAMPEP_0206330436 /NCGR_PEP_ID=MMETSP0106_2-20121207/23718_1 /ASSEMBLY_ACC=CAM_ASM_000206 /TAXON_ID=81532 /ORGANISM="Acanthoeca-like sp., Strain 10tr" /LENGTH=111 /DNA_ID=CAMNT_0053763195 /DNA_START=691 /DNA_END=1027 /DNA_ORIENTATION=-